MKTIILMKKNCCILVLLLFLSLAYTFKVNAQCTNWQVSTQVIAGSACSGNGSFSVSLSGADVSNLTNVQYGIALGTKGFSIPLNNSNIFTNIPPGTYQVSVVGLCNGNYVGKTIKVTMPGAYKTPNLNLVLGRHTINCGNYGVVNVMVDNNRAPYTLTILSKPSSYGGPTSFTMLSTNFSVRNLPGGNYTMQVVDACGNSSFPFSITVPSYLANKIDIVGGDLGNIGCDTFIIQGMRLANNSIWGSYFYDTLYKVSVQISNNAFAPTGFLPTNAASWKFKLAPGFTLKDCYGQTLTYTIKPPCGSNFTITQTIPYAYLSANYIEQKCNVSFKANLVFNGLLCYPITYTIKDANNISFGNYTTTSTSITTPSLPLGAYLIQFTTADGYSGSASTSATPITGNPYQVSVITGEHGLHNYAQGFKFSTTASLGTKTIELFNGPPGYVFYYPYWYYQQISTDYIHLMTPPWLPQNSQIFPIGNYVWKITDSCGVYYLPITVDSTHLYQYTVGISKQYQTCQGLWVFPTGTATNNGVSKPIQFSFLKNNRMALPSPGNSWGIYPLGDSVLITDPGEYRILPFSTSRCFTYQDIFSNLIYPNPYTQTFAFNYTIKPVQIDVYKTSGYACQNGASATILTLGKDGIPFSGTPYHYSLALAGNGITGPYIATNLTGVFTNFGGIVNNVYEVKVEDSCGSFAIQKVKILDLQTARLISNSKYVACERDSVVLFAPYFLNAIYTWTGPNGFTSGIQNPVIHNVTSQNEGVYRLSVSIPGCVSLTSDSTVLVVNDSPPKPTINVHCGPPILLTINNHQSQYKYKWELNEFFVDDFELYDENDSIGVYFPGAYRAVTVDTSTGCTSDYSDTLNLTQYAFDTSAFIATIYSSHLQICTGDTTTLVANSNALSYQWFKNGIAIPGATSPVFITNTPGNYKVYVEGGTCQNDTSDEVTIIIVPIPSVNIIAPIRTICNGDTAQIIATYGPSYQYTWFHNGITIPQANDDTLKAFQTGVYYVVVSNGGCVATSDTISIKVLPILTNNLTPAVDQYICQGAVVNFSTNVNSSYSYTWFHNGNIIPNTTTNQYQTSNVGIYFVVVSNGICTDTSVPVAVNYLPEDIHLGNDTVLCIVNPVNYRIGIPTGYDTILWSTGATTDSITVINSGIYWVNASNICGNYVDTFVVYSINDLQPNLPDDTLICNAENEAVFSVPEILSNILWSNGATTHSIIVSTPGTYYVTATSPCGVLSDTILITFCQPKIETISLSSQAICVGECITVSAQYSNYPQSWLWSFDGGTPSTYNGQYPTPICYNTVGNYNITLIASNAGGSDTIISSINVFPIPQGRFEDTTINVPYKTPLHLQACAEGQHVYWYRGDSLVCNDCPVYSFEAKNWQSVYYCIVENAEGICSDTCLYKVSVYDIPSDVYLPTAFSPNGDGLNETFKVLTDNPNFLLHSLSVYNRWGQRIYYGTNDKAGWDGTFKGEKVDVGVYFWSLKYRILGVDKDFFYRKGDVTVIR